MTLISIVTGDLGQLLVFSRVLLMEVKMLKIQVLIAKLFCTILINYNYEDNGNKLIQNNIQCL